MTDLDALRPEVMEAAAKLDDFDSAFGTGGHWQIIRAELLRLAHECAELHKAAARGALAHMKTQAELAALKARIAEAQECGVVALCGGGASLSHEPYPSLVGKRVRLVVEE